MRTISLGQLKQEMAAGIPGRRCVEAWLGYGQVLFLALADQPVPDLEPGEPYPHPHYQIETDKADWRVEEGGALRGTADDERDHAVAACQPLLGRHAVDWYLDDATFVLTVYFEGNFTLTVEPWQGERWRGGRAWAFINPAREYLSTLCGGGLYLVHGDEPPKSQWSYHRVAHRHGGYP